MNFYGLPEFVAYSVLLCIAYVLIKQNEEARLRYWLMGWVLIFLHAAIFMLFSQTYPFDVIARGTLIIAGQAFILAAFFQRSTWPPRSQLLAPMGLCAALNLIFTVASAAHNDLQPTNQYLAPFYLLIVAGAASALWLAAADRPKSAWRFGSSIALIVAIYALQAWLLRAYGVGMASQWLMCWTYLAVAYFFVNRAPKPTMGILFTALSFALWGAVFPVYSFLMIYAPDISNHIESGVWNLPKFLAAACMILVLLEERVIAATRLATHDQLTSLPNRRLYIDRFEQTVQRAARHRSGFALLVIDLDKFKLVNDTLGHQAGDELLRAVSERFRSGLRGIDTLARIGGDEFAAILDGVHKLADAEVVAGNLCKSLQTPIALRGRLYRARASMGLALYPDDGSTLDVLQAVADERMYADKEQRQKETTSGESFFDSRAMKLAPQV